MYLVNAEVTNSASTITVSAFETHGEAISDLGRLKEIHRDLGHKTAWPEYGSRDSVYVTLKNGEHVRFSVAAE